MDRVRVLHVLEAIEGGTARHLVDVVRTTPHTEHHVAMPRRRVGGLTDETLEPRLTAAGATIHHVAMRRRPPSAANALALARLLTLTRRIRPHVVHGHSAIGGALARAVARLARTPCVYTPNGVPVGRASLAIERLLGRVTDRFVAVSASEAAFARRARLVPGERIRVIPNGIETEQPPGLEPPLRARLGIDVATPLVGTIARLVHQKAPERFVAIARAVAAMRPDAHFVLIGDGPLRDDVTAAVREAGLDRRLHIIRALPDAARALPELDVFVLPSRFEGAPYAPLEAMRAGVPVVLSDVVGNRDSVDDESGILVGEHDVDAMAAAVEALLASPERRAALAAAARDRLARMFDVRAMGRSLHSTYDELAVASRSDDRDDRKVRGRRAFP